MVWAAPPQYVHPSGADRLRQLPFVAGAPLSLDFGIPITSEKINKKGNQFNFSFGTRF